jgi:hypothetical protein
VVGGVFDSSMFKGLSQHSYAGAEEREPFHDNQSPSFGPDRGNNKNNHQVKVKLSLGQAVETNKVVISRESHIV